MKYEGVEEKIGIIKGKEEKRWREKWVGEGESRKQSKNLERRRRQGRTERKNKREKGESRG